MLGNARSATRVVAAKTFALNGLLVNAVLRYAQKRGRCERTFDVVSNPLQRLKAAGFRLAMLTNSPDAGRASADPAYRYRRLLRAAAECRAGAPLQARPGWVWVGGEADGRAAGGLHAGGARRLEHRGCAGGGPAQRLRRAGKASRSSRWRPSRAGCPGSAGAARPARRLADRPTSAAGARRGRRPAAR